MIDIVYILNQIDNFMYFPILIIVMSVSGLYFTTRTRGVQIRLFPESVSCFLNRQVMKIQYRPFRRCLSQPLQGLEPAISLVFQPPFVWEVRAHAFGCG